MLDMLGDRPRAESPGVFGEAEGGRTIVLPFLSSFGDNADAELTRDLRGDFGDIVESDEVVKRVWWTEFTR